MPSNEYICACDTTLTEEQKRDTFGCGNCGYCEFCKRRVQAANFDKHSWECTPVSARYIPYQQPAKPEKTVSQRNLFDMEDLDS